MMRIDEMQARTAELRLAIQGLCYAFEKDTGCHIESIEVGRRGLPAMGSSRAPDVFESPNDLTVSVCAESAAGRECRMADGRDMTVADAQKLCFAIVDETPREASWIAVHAADELNIDARGLTRDQLRRILAVLDRIAT
jgi:hypothetical protein